MKTDQPSVTIMIHRDGALDSQTFRLPLWALRIGMILGVCLTAGIVLMVALWLPVARAAATVPGLKREVARLEADNSRIRELVAALDSAEVRYGRVRRMLGADIVPDPVSLSSSLPLAPPIHAGWPLQTSRYQRGPTVPRHWPLDEPGYITRGQVGSGTREEAHPGIDIAMPIGSMVRASGGGTVLQTGLDPEYGIYVLLQHPEGYQTMYGHLSRSTAATGTQVESGQVIGLSGNTGRSSAPHLHFEIRQGSRALDPLTMVKEGS